MPKRSNSFLIVIGLLGIGLGFTLSILDPIIYTEKVRQIAPPALKNTVLSFITIMALLVALIAQPIIGHWSDRTESRWGKRIPFLISGAIGLSFSLVLMSFTNNLWVLTIVAMLISAFSNTVQSVWQALIPDQVPESQHGTAAGIKTLLELIGVVAGITVASVTIARGNVWVAPLTAGGLFWFILPITIYALWKTRTGQTTQNVSTVDIANPFQNHNSKADNNSQTTSLDAARTAEGPHNCPAPKRRQAHFLRIPNEASSLFVARLSALIYQSPAFFWWIVNRLLFWSAGIAIRTFLLNYMEDGLQLSLTEVQALSNRLLLILGIGIFLLVLPAGAMADRLGRRPLLITAGLLASSGSFLLLFIHNPTLLFIAFGLIACGAAIFASTSWALATDIVPKAEGALYLGIANTATVAGSISGRLGGPLIDGLNQLTLTSNIGYLVVFAVAALFFAGSSLVVLKIPEHHS